MDFLILGPLCPETGYHFLEGGGWVAGWGSKFFAQKVSSIGQNQYYKNNKRFNDNTADRRLLGQWFKFQGAQHPRSADWGLNRRPRKLRSSALPLDRCMLCSGHVSNCLKPSLSQKKPKLPGIHYAGPHGCSRTRIVTNSAPKPISGATEGFHEKSNSIAFGNAPCREASYQRIS